MIGYHGYVGWRQPIECVPGYVLGVRLSKKTRVNWQPDRAKMKETREQESMAKRSDVSPLCNTKWTNELHKTNEP